MIQHNHTTFEFQFASKDMNSINKGESQKALY
jgi:hypothetical protein